MYDTVIVHCPNCGEEHSCQSKSGDCLLEVHILEDCPDDILSDVNRHSPYLCDCGTSFDIDIENKIAKGL